MRKMIYWRFSDLYSDFLSEHKIVNVQVDNDTACAILDHFDVSWLHWKIGRNHPVIELYNKNEVLYIWRKRGGWYLTLQRACEGKFMKELLAS